MTTRKHKRIAGFKVHVADLPGRWQDAGELEMWLSSLNVFPAEVARMDLSPYGRWQAMLTFERPEDARRAVEVLHGHRLEGPLIHTSTARFWRPLAQ